MFVSFQQRESDQRETRYRLLMPSCRVYAKWRILKHTAQLSGLELDPGHHYFYGSSIGPAVSARVKPLRPRQIQHCLHLDF